MTNAIEVKNLVKNYKQIEAVKDISFTVEEGAFFAFLGINGAGKSTTINILSTVLEKTSGSVKISGYDIDKQRDKAKEQIGIVFQNSVLDKQLTVKENLESRASYYGMTGREIKKRVLELSEMFGLDEIMNRRFERLSGGQKRRVDIARALLNNPKILFLDEPTTGLDPQTRVQVWSIIHKLRKTEGLTVFLTTHYMQETVDCDRVIILDNGQILADDTPNNLKKRYAHNNLVWYTEQTEEKDKLLAETDFEHINSAYRIKTKDSTTALQLINKFNMQDFEVIKGDMDNVFLKVTGKRLGD